MADNLSRASILRWLESLGLPIPRIEDVGKGVVLCRLVNLVDGARLRYRDAPATEAEYLQNLLLVKNYMDARKIKLCFPAEKMCKLRMQDNLEAIKWFYSYWEARQGGCSLGASADTGAGTMDKPPCASAKITPAAGPFTTEERASASAPGPQMHRGGRNASAQAAQGCCVPPEGPACDRRLDSLSLRGHPDGAAPQTEPQDKSNKIAELQEIARVFENERDFYYDKLISIEALLVGSGAIDNGLKEKILDIMYEVEFDDE